MGLRQLDHRRRHPRTTGYEPMAGITDQIRANTPQETEYANFLRASGMGNLLDRVPRPGTLPQPATRPPRRT
ncbi:hypothetical protein ACXNSR_00165 [Streptomyces sp. NC-S4]